MCARERLLYALLTEFTGQGTAVVALNRQVSFAVVGLDAPHAGIPLDIRYCIWHSTGMQKSTIEAAARLAQVNEMHRKLESLARVSDLETQRAIQEIVSAGLDAYFVTKAGL